MNDDAEHPMPLNDISIVHERAEQFVDHVRKHQLSPLQVGYVAVWASLNEASLHLLEVADMRLPPGGIRDLAQRLHALAEETLRLGAHVTDSSG